MGVGGAAAFGAMLHAVNHSLTKAMLFLAAGNILALYRTKSTSHARGLLSTLPVTGVLWLAGFLAICGSPPFGPFISELTILKGILDAGRPAAAVVYLLALAIVFVGMATIILRMAYGPPPGSLAGSTNAAGTPRREPFWSIAPPLALGLAVLILGVYVPPQLADLMQRAATALGAN
jgi:hydrogenase-4 component F